MKTVIITDSSSDLPLKFIEDNNIPALGLICQFRGNEFEDAFGKTLGHKEFYNAVRKGEIATTSQINVYRYTEEFRKHLTQGKSIIYIGFSSALSGCVNSAVKAREDLMEEYKDADITIIDTKSASLGQGLLVYYAYEMLKKGSSKEEIVDWIENNKLKMNHWFTVEDLIYLKRGGRISGASAMVGTILNIKPIMHVDDDGRLVPVTKVNGRKKSLKMLAEMLKERIVHPEEQVIAISHGDCQDDAEYLQSLIQENCHVKDIIIGNVGPVIGSHSGPGTVALFFIGEKR